MNGRTASLLNRFTDNSAPALRNALKREWRNTPRNQRSKLRGRIRHMLKLAETHTPTVEEMAGVQHG
jgi:hypothetical protein